MGANTETLFCVSHGRHRTRMYISDGIQHRQEDESWHCRLLGHQVEREERFTSVFAEDDAAPGEESGTA